MIEVLLGLPAKVKTLVDRLTSTRATNLDNLDAAVSTRSAASTALSNVVWTDARAGKLDTAALEASPLLAAPIATGLIPTAGTALYLAAVDAIGPNNSGLTAFTVSSLTYIDMINYTGKGVLEFVGMSSETAAAQIQITIDGLLVLDSTLAGGGAGQSNNAAYVGTLNKQSWSISLSHIPFKTSLRIQVKGNPINKAWAYARYRKTA